MGGAGFKRRAGLTPADSQLFGSLSDPNNFVAGRSDSDQVDRDADVIADEGDVVTGGGWKVFLGPAAGDVLGEAGQVRCL